MTDDRLALQTLLEKTPDANYLREMIGFAAQRLMANVPPNAWRSAMATATATGRPAPERSNCVSRSCGKAAR